MATRVEPDVVMQAVESRPEMQNATAPAAGDEVFVLPASSAQARMWFLAQLGDGDAYAMPVAVRLRGVLDPGALADALTGIVRRHEVLRTTFAAKDGEPVQVVHPPAPVPLPLTDLAALPQAEREAAAERILRDEARRPFDLRRGPLLRALLIRLADDEHLALCAMHHIVSDGWSLEVLLRELGAGYAAALQGRPSPLPEPALQYADYAAWQRTWLTGDAAARQLDYWKTRLADAPVLELPVDHPRAAEPGSQGGRVAFRLSADVFAAVRALGARHRATPMITLLAAFKTLLARYTGSVDVVVGAPVAGRNRPELEELIGLFVNTLALRTELAGDPSFAQVVDRVRDTVVQAQAHQDLPFDRVADAVRTGADPRRNPLFEVSFTYASARRAEMRLPGLLLSAAPADAEATRLDLEAHLMEDEGGLYAALVYRAGLYERATMERMAGHFARLLDGALAAPETRISALPLLGEDERRTVVEAWSAEGAADPADRCIHPLFEAQAARAPDAPAVVSGDAVLTYAQLNARANRLAHHLRTLSVGPDARVAICVERGAEMVVAVLGVLKAGGAYVPLDPAYPAARLRYMLADSAPAVVLTQTSIAAAREGLFEGLSARVLALDAPAWDGAADTNPDRGALDPAHLAYVIYTSGSTGRPKGVMVAHRGVASLAAAQARTLGVEPASRVLQFASFSFDACVFEMVMALCQGASLHVPSGVDLLAGDALELVVTRGRITHVTLPPAVLPTLAATADLATVRTMVLAGEALPAAAVARWGGGRRLINAYGPTEAAVWTTLHECRTDERGNPPIGRPIPNARVYLLDPAGQPVPAAVPGELYIGGAGVARGYLGRPALTAQRFVPDPFGEPGARLYRTGDLGRWRADGTIEFLGRNDFQVKIRGFRIEPGEIEARLREHPAVRDVVVIAREDDARDPRLVAYWVGEETGAEALRRHAGERLPEHMVPAAFVRLDALPLTPSGKPDRRALPPPEGDACARRGYEAPRGETEQALAEIWSEVLGVDRVGRRDDFLALGGNSLLVMQVAARVHAALGVDLPLGVLLTDVTVAGLAARIAAAEGAARPAPAAIPRADRAAPLPLSFPQERLWFLDRAEETDGAFTTSIGVRIEGAGLDADALERAFGRVIDRHEVLRTVFPAEGGQARQHVLSAAPFRLERAELRGGAEADRSAAVARLGRELAARPYDLARGPLLRALLVRTGDAEHVLLLNLHHIVFDGWSAGVLVREAAACYEAVRAGRAPSLPELPVQYADYAAWQRAWAATDAAAEQLAWWTRRLAGLPALDLSAGRARPERAGYHGAALLVELGPERTERVRAAARGAQATEFMVLLAAFNLVLAHHGRTRDLVVGTDLAGRVRPELEPLIGFFVNEVVLRTDLAGDPDLREVLARVREVALDAYRHQDVPFALLVRELAGGRALGATPLFQVMFGMDNTPAAPLEMDGLRVAPVDAGADVSPWELSLYLREGARGIAGAFRYRTALFDPAAVEDLRTDFLAAVDALCGDPDERLGSVLDRLSATERQRWDDRARILEGAARLRLRARPRQAVPVAPG
jgi:amino acid adenylation domain-containing protein